MWKLSMTHRKHHPVRTLAKRFLVQLGVCCFSAIVLTACVSPTTQRVDLDPAAVEKEADKQRELALSDFHRQRNRLWDVAFPILRSGIPLCGDDVQPKLGVLLHNKYSYEDAWRETAELLFSVDDQLRFSHISEGSPAASIGIKAGDILVGIGGIEPLGADAMDDVNEVIDDLLEAEGQTIEVTISGMDGVQRVKKLTPVAACDFNPGLVSDDRINAYADGKSIVITSGMMNFARSDNELATVVAHELAHNAMDHINAKTINSAGGLVIDILAALAGVDTQGIFTQLAGQAYSQEFELEADYVGVYLMALAGLEIDRSPDFWRRMATRNPGSIDYASSHPTAPERFLSMEEVVGEIHRKQELGQALEPEIKSSGN
jgi:hypothetical protein